MSDLKVIALRKEIDRLRAKNRALINLFGQLKDVARIELFLDKEYAVVRTPQPYEIETKTEMFSAVDSNEVEGSVLNEDCTYYLVKPNFKEKFTQKNVGAYMDEITTIDGIDFDWEYLTDDQLIEDDFMAILISGSYICLFYK